MRVAKAVSAIAARFSSFGFGLFAAWFMLAILVSSPQLKIRGILSFCYSFFFVYYNDDYFIAKSMMIIIMFSPFRSLFVFSVCACVMRTNKHIIAIYVG